MARSNRQLTQFAVNKLRQYLLVGPDTFRDETAGNTRVQFFACSECMRRSIQILLYDKKILELVINPFNPRAIVGMLAFTGDFYDSKGRPSRTTRERLNGLFDTLGTQGYLPEGVRVFIQEDGQSYVGKGDAYKQFNANSPAVGLLCHPRDLILT